MSPARPRKPARPERSVRSARPARSGAASRPALGPLRVARSTGVVEDTLAGGLRVLAARRPGIPMVELRLGFRLPGDLIAKPAALTVLSESILAGTDRHDRAGLASAVQRLGGSLATGAHRDWFLVAGSVLAEHLVEMLEIVGEVLEGARYPSGEVAGDRARMAEEVMLDLSRPEVVADQELRRRLHPGHPYASGLPSPGALRRVSGTSLRRIHASALAPSAGQLVLVGDLTAKRAISAASGALGPWLSEGRDDALPPLAAVPAMRLGPMQLFDRPGAVQSNVRVARVVPGRGDPRWPATSLANLIFGGMFASRLVENLRERHGYTYSPHARISHGRAGSSFVIGAEVATASTAPALVETWYELGRIATLGVTDHEHESAVRYALGTLAYQTATQAGLASALVEFAIMGLDPGYLARHAAALKATTRSEVDEAARRLFAPAQMATVVLGDAEAIGSSLSLVDEVQLRPLSP